MSSRRPRAATITILAAAVALVPLESRAQRRPPGGYQQPENVQLTLEVVDGPPFATTGMSLGELMSALHSGDMRTLEKARADVVAYVHGLRDTMVEKNWDTNDPSCQKVWRSHHFSGVSSHIDAEFRKWWEATVSDAVFRGPLHSSPNVAIGNVRKAQQDADRKRELVAAGKQDMLRLFSMQGRCNTKVIDAVYRNVRSFMFSEFEQRPRAVSQTRTRPLTATDLSGLDNPAQRAALEKQVADLTARGYEVTECTYDPTRPTPRLVWNLRVPVLSLDLQRAIAQVMYAALPCPKDERSFDYFRPIAAGIGTAATARPKTRPLNPNVRAVFHDVQTYPAGQTPANPNGHLFLDLATRAAAAGQEVIECPPASAVAPPQKLWYMQLPVPPGAKANLDQKDLLRDYLRFFNVMPIAVTGCPADPQQTQNFMQLND